MQQFKRHMRDFPRPEYETITHFFNFQRAERALPRRFADLRENLRGRYEAFPRTPSACGFFFMSSSGGFATLHHRLISRHTSGVPSKQSGAVI
jgi:hypothetical protein